MFLGDQDWVHLFDKRNFITELVELIKELITFQHPSTRLIRASNHLTRSSAASPENGSSTLLTLSLKEQHWTKDMCRFVKENVSSHFWNEPSNLQVCVVSPVWKHLTQLGHIEQIASSSVEFLQAFNYIFLLCTF